MKKSMLILVSVASLLIFAVTGFAFANNTGKDTQTEQTATSHNKKDCDKCTKGKCDHKTDCANEKMCEGKGTCEKNKTCEKKEKCEKKENCEKNPNCTNSAKCK